MRVAPGVYFAINAPAGIVGSTAAAATQTISSWGYAVSPVQMQTLAQQVGETTLLNRTGGAPSLAMGMAQIFSGTIGGAHLLAIWYHFAIMFEALFILTVLDAGTRVGRFMVQETLRHVWEPLGAFGLLREHHLFQRADRGNVGLLPLSGRVRPAGRNQFAVGAVWNFQPVARIRGLVVATTIVLKMGKAKYVWVTMVPMAWLVTVTMTASYQKIFDASPAIGFLASARARTALLAAGNLSAAQITTLTRLRFNDYLDAWVTAALASMVIILLIEAIFEWWRLLGNRVPAVLHESSYEATQWAEGD